MSCNQAAVVVQEVSKSYKMFDKPQDRLKQLLCRGRKNYFREFWALQNVSFSIPQGQTVGIIGKNGSGKSTLLQLITGTLEPSAGVIETHGRIAALLELGSGFNPEFTGRENVYMNGAIMGLSRDEIDMRLPDIETFADIGEFIDQPVKIYSSGMYVRLAFACAVNVNPDILVVDEALAVGDIQFQLKCIEKMKSFKKQGKTILFVSHDVYSVRNFCDQAIWMMNGQVHQWGEVNTVVEQYEEYMNRLAAPEPILPADSPAAPNSIDKILTIEDAFFRDVGGKRQSCFEYGQELSVEVTYSLHEPMTGLVGGVALFDAQNNYICGLNTKLDQILLPSQPGQYKLQISYADVRLLPGAYFIDVGFFESSALVQLDFKARYKSFRVASGSYFAEGITFIPHEWTCERIDS